MHRYWACAVVLNGSTVTYSDYARSNYTFQYNFQQLYRDKTVVSFIEVRVDSVVNNELALLFNDRVLVINGLLK